MAGRTNAPGRSQLVIAVSVPLWVLRANDPSTFTPDGVERSDLSRHLRILSAIASDRRGSVAVFVRATHADAASARRGDDLPR
jgi:hypothetical protein